MSRRKHSHSPIYIPSLGRWEQRHTVRALQRMGVDNFHVIVEAQEHAKYAAVIDRKHLLVLDPAYVRDYDTCDDKGDSIRKGSGPARNFGWEHALSRGAAYYWCVDDNIPSFYRMHANRKHMVRTPAFFEAMEHFVQRYSNVAMAGPHYEMFVHRKMKCPPFNANRRIYSCNLIRTDVPFRWRARYNEDVDLSLRMLKAGWCTVLFNAFLQNKKATQSCRGGNTDTIYKSGTTDKSKMLVALHPDVARLAWRWNRAHHYVDYRPFEKNALRLRDDVQVPTEPNEFGMRLDMSRAERG